MRPDLQVMEKRACLDTSKNENKTSKIIPFRKIIKIEKKDRHIMVKNKIPITHKPKAIQLNCSARANEFEQSRSAYANAALRKLALFSLHGQNETNCKKHAAN